MRSVSTTILRSLVVASLLLASVAHAQVLPEDRFDALYHSYEGDNVTITGPSLLARKKIGKNLSVSANYYVDSISSASVDVVSYASPYTEERKEYSIGVDYLWGDSILSAGFSNSDESDFTSNTAYFGIAQEVFGGLTTVSLSFARGADEISQADNPAFDVEEADRRIYRLGVSQVITKNFVMTVDFEAITDEGYLNNPYRQVRYVNALDTQLFSTEPELYPETRTSGALAVGGRYFLAGGPSAVYANARMYGDSWGIEAWNAKVGYTYTLRSKWLFDASYRYYTQTGADFYSDLFPNANSQTFYGRDKEISTFNDHSFKLDVTYDFSVDKWTFLKRGTANLSYNYVIFDYDDFRDIPAGGPAGEEPLFGFSADIIQAYLSFWF
jgi:hypothetical protein